MLNLYIFWTTEKLSLNQSFTHNAIVKQLFKSNVDTKINFKSYNYHGKMNVTTGVNEYSQHKLINRHSLLIHWGRKVLHIPFGKNFQFFVRKDYLSPLFSVWRLFKNKCAIPNVSNFSDIRKLVHGNPPSLTDVALLDSDQDSPVSALAFLFVTGKA